MRMSKIHGRTSRTYDFSSQAVTVAHRDDGTVFSLTYCAYEANETAWSITLTAHDLGLIRADLARHERRPLKNT